MKSIVELNAELDQLRVEQRAIIEAGEAEVRKLDETEETRLAEIAEAITAKEGEIAEAEQRNEQINLNKTHKMEEKKTFSLLSAIRALADQQPLDEVAAAVNEAGRAQMRAAGASITGNLVIPTTRSTVSVTASSGATVPVDVAPILDELRAESVLEKAGATFYTGLVGDLKVPMMTAASVAWAGEAAAASDAAAAVASVTLQPKRLTAYLDVSKQMLIQSDSNVEAQLQANLVRAIAEKFEETVLGSAASTTSKPAGVIYGKNIETTTTWSGVAGIFAGVERAKGHVSAVIASPESKAAFRGMEYNNKGQLVYQNGMLEDVPCYSTANIANDTYIAGDFRYLAIGQWGGIDITVDPFTQAGNGSIRLVINVYMDAKVASEAGSVIKVARTKAQVATPVGPTTWTSGSTLTLTMTCDTEGAIIYYTTDGSDPTTSSNVYDSSNKPTISATATVKAIAVKDGMITSAVFSQTYTKP